MSRVLLVLLLALVLLLPRVYAAISLPTGAHVLFHSAAPDATYEQAAATHSSGGSGGGSSSNNGMQQRAPTELEGQGDDVVVLGTIGTLVVVGAVVYALHRTRQWQAGEGKRDRDRNRGSMDDDGYYGGAMYGGNSSLYHRRRSIAGKQDRADKVNSGKCGACHALNQCT